MAAEVIDDLRVKCLLLPLQIGPMLVPNSVIAEIVPAQRHHPETAIEQPWVLGTVEWRSMVLPLLSLERLCDTAPYEFPIKVPFVVLHRLNQTSGHNYYAVTIAGIPHFQFVSAEALQTRGTNDYPYMSHGVEFRGENTLIPDFDAIEERVESLGLGKTFVQ